MADNWFNSFLQGAQNKAFNNDAFNRYVNFMNTNPVARTAGKAAGAFGGYDVLESARDLAKGNIPGAAFNAAEAIAMNRFGGALGKAGINAARTLSAAPLKTVTKGLANKAGIAFTGQSIFSGNSPASARSKAVPSTTPTTPTVTPPDFSKMTQEEKMAWIDNNDILSSNFQQVYGQQNPVGALELQLINLKDPMADMLYREALTQANEEWNRTKALTEAQKKASEKQYGVEKRGVGQEVSGQKLDTRAALAAAGMLSSPGQYDLGLEGITNAGNRALAQLAQAKAVRDQNIAQQRSNADLQRKAAMLAATQARADRNAQYRQNVATYGWGGKI